MVGHFLQILQLYPSISAMDSTVHVAVGSHEVTVRHTALWDGQGVTFCSLAVSEPPGTAVNTLRCHRASQVSQGLHVMKICHTVGESRGSHKLRIFSTFVFHLLSNLWLCPCQPNLMDAKSQITDVQPVPVLIRHGKLRQHFSSVCVFVLLFILSVCAWT